MHVARCDNRFTKLICKMNYLPVNLVKLLFGFNHSVAEHKCVIAVRLNFKIIANVGKFKQLCLGLARINCLIKLTCFARTADNKTLSVRKQFALWHSGMTIEIFKV